MDENTKNKETAMKKKKLIGQIVLTSVFGVIIIGISLAIFFAKASGGLNNITTKELVDVTYAEGSTLRLTNNTPIFEDEIESRATEFNFTINNPNSTPVYATIDLTDISMSSSLKNYDFKWALYEGGTKLTTGSFIDAETTLNLYNNSVINGNSNKTYKIRIWLNETGKTQNFQGTSFTSKVKVTAYSRQLRTLNSKILSDNTVNTNAPVFSTTSTDKGLYVQKEDSTKSEFGFPTYYYRGNVTNNYVQFGTYKEDVTNLTLNNDNNNDDGRTETKVASAGDPILWRIVRINGDGSIRLIAEYNTSATEEAYGTTSDYANSNIKSRIENWYNENIGNDNTLNNKVTMGNYCNDISDNYNGATNRLTQNNPSFICSSGGVEVNSKIGLITADEVKFAGANGTSASDMVVNINTYLNNHTWFWSMTPYQYDIIYTPTPNYGSAGANMESYENNVASDRPVINLKPNVIIKSGTGTKDNPYVISEASL